MTPSLTPSCPAVSSHVVRFGALSPEMNALRASIQAALTSPPADTFERLSLDNEMDQSFRKVERERADRLKADERELMEQYVLHIADLVTGGMLDNPVEYLGRLSAEANQYGSTLRDELVYELVNTQGEHVEPLAAEQVAELMNLWHEVEEKQEDPEAQIRLFEEVSEAVQDPQAQYRLASELLLDWDESCHQPLKEFLEAVAITNIIFMEPDQAQETLSLLADEDTPEIPDSVSEVLLAKTAAPLQPTVLKAFGEKYPFIKKYLWK